MSEKCPYCYRTSGIWYHDPILLPDGARYKWSDDTHLIEESDITQRIYKGIYQISETEVKELQDALKLLESENLLPANLTTFSPLNTSGIFQITGKHIKEMRDSVEKLLTQSGLSKTDYFNYDELGNHIISPAGDKIEWTDAITEATDLEKFQVKAIHIEDLRHTIQTIWEETWTENNPTWAKSSSHSIINPVYPNFGYDDNESKIILADHEWTDCDYRFGIYNYFQPEITGSASLNLSDNLITTSSSFYAEAHTYDSLDFIHFNFTIDFYGWKSGFIMKRITKNTVLSWDGTFAGTVSSPNLVYNYAAIGFTIFSPDWGFWTYPTFIKRGTNCFENSPDPQTIILSSWSGNAINLWDLLVSLGRDMNYSYFISEVSFTCVNQLWGSAGWHPPYTLTSTNSFTMGKITIT